MIDSFVHFLNNNLPQCRNFTILKLDYTIYPLPLPISVRFFHSDKIKSIYHQELRISLTKLDVYAFIWSQFIVNFISLING